MKKIIVCTVCVLAVMANCNIAAASSWNQRKKETKQLLKKSNLVSSDRFELTYAQKITDRMSNHFAYILKDTKTGVEYLLYTVGSGDATSIGNIGICPLLQKMPAMPVPQMAPVMPKVKTMGKTESTAEEGPFAGMAIPEKQVDEKTEADNKDEEDSAADADKEEQ